MTLFTCGCGLQARRCFAPADGGAGTPRPGRVIDIHAHFFPREWLDILARDGRAEGADCQFAPEGFTVAAAGSRNGPLPSRFWNLEERVAEMDATGVTIQALSLTSPMCYWASPGLSARLAKAYNDAASAAHQRYPDRFLGLITLPLPHIDLALAELERARALPGMRGVYLGTHIDGADLSDPRFLPVFQAIEAAGLHVFLHPLLTMGGSRLSSFYLNNFLGNPFETATAAAHLIFGGVLDRCPQLSVNLPHAGGALPILIGRFDHGSARRKETRHMTRPPSDYLKRFTYDTIAHSVPIMRWLVDFLGAERIVLGSDYCFDMGYERPLEMVDQLGLTPADRGLVLEGTVARLLGLPALV
jgi:aminocarboxymuconate-semialdehyde decarboxylase